MLTRFRLSLINLIVFCHRAVSSSLTKRVLRHQDAIQNSLAKRVWPHHDALHRNLTKRFWRHQTVNSSLPKLKLFHHESCIVLSPKLMRELVDLQRINITRNSNKLPKSNSM